MTSKSEIFISYAHIDNLSPVDGELGWVSRLHRALEIKVSQRLGEKIEIWRDPKLKGNDYFSEKLLEYIKDTKLMLPIFSPRYLKSEWCRHELDEFCKCHSSNGKWRVDDRSRVFKIIKTPVPREQYPLETQPLLGYEFYKINPENGVARELDKMFGPEAEQEFWAKVDDLAHDMTECLERLHGDCDNAKLEPVYLVPTTIDLQAFYEAVKRDLQTRGYKVLPNVNLPYQVSELMDVLQEQIARCQVFVHLIGGSYGFVPEGTKKSVGELQHEIAAQRLSRGEFTHLIWMPKDLKCDDERQSEFIKRLENELGYEHHAELLKTSLENLKELIICRLNRPEAPAQDKSSMERQESEPKQIYLMCDQRDLDDLHVLENFFFERGYEVILPAFAGDEREIRLDHEQNLVDCDAVLIFFGAANLLWLRRILRDIKKSKGYGRVKPLLAKAVYLAPPFTEEKCHFRSLEIDIIKQQVKNFSFEPLQLFLDNMNGDDGCSLRGD